MPSAPHACFGMYPFEPLRPAWDELIEAVHQRVSWVPAGLDWSEDVHDSWRDRNCVLGHACGWPVAAQLRDDVRVVGAFDLAFEGAEGHRYRSRLLANRPASPAEYATADTVVAANSPDSLSGWISLVTALVGAGGRWPGSVLWTGAHRESLRAVTDGRVELACIDAWTLALLQRIAPGIDDGLSIIALGPWIPSPAVVVRADATDRQVDEVRTAFTEVLADPASAAIRRALLIDGFVPLDESDYAPLLELTPAG